MDKEREIRWASDEAFVWLAEWSCTTGNSQK